MRTYPWYLQSNQKLLVVASDAFGEEQKKDVDLQ